MTNPTDNRNAEKRVKPASRGQKPYSPPELIEWGRLTDLTQGGKGARSDFGPIVTKAI